MSLKDKIKKLDESFDLKKRFPNYFDKRIFRTLTILMFIMFFISLYFNDWKLVNVYAECKSDTPCQNPFYLCSNIEMSEQSLFYSSGRYCLPEVTWKTRSICEAGYCNKEYLQPNEVIGNKPNWYNEYFSIILILIYILGLGFNHYLYKRKNEDNNKKLN